MSKQQPSTYKFPENLRFQYHQLMNSQTNFMKKLTAAEQRKLEDLYALLKKTWRENLTEILKNTLEKSNQEFRQIQNEIASDCETFKQSTRDQFEMNLENDYNNLMQNRNQRIHTLKIWSDDINQKKLNLLERKTNWPKEKKIIFNAGKVTLKGLRQRLHHLRNELMNLEIKEELVQKEEKFLNDKQQILNNKLQILKSKLQILNEKQLQLNIEEQPFQKVLNDQKRILNENLNERRLEAEKILNEKKTVLNSNLTRLNKEFEATTVDLENKLMMQLGSKLAEEHLDWPEEWKNYLKQANSSALLGKKNAILDACKQLENGLKRELGESGLSIDDFLILIDRNT
ncbi:hypothetical protein DUE52_31835 [Larkinella punicea]|uniref:Uncharacterized protein n=1 Tax=Larkinella punicea TaxID=2315727 RepID=A0A368JFJ9_9BACT|nr:hypothetical protein DUE52_31835 [Larkinella punicea]